MVCDVENRLPKVLIANHLYPPDTKGGAEVLVHDLTNGLQQCGWDVEVVATCDSSHTGMFEEIIDGVKVTRFHPPNLYWANNKNHRSTLVKLLWRTISSFNVVAAWRFWKVLRKIKPDIVHTHNTAYFSPLIFPLIRWSGARTVHTAHDYYMVCPLWTMSCQARPQGLHRMGLCGPYRAWTLGFAKHVDVFCAPSQSMIDGHEPYFGSSSPRRQVLRNGTRLPDFGDLTKPSREDGRLRLLFLGQLIPDKGVQVMLDALAMIPGDVAVELHVAGSGPMQTDVEAAALRDDRLRFHGFVKAEQKFGLLADSDVLLFPSVWPENAPIAILEAMAAGMAILGSRIGGVPELVHDGENGVLVPANDASRLAEAIIALAKDHARLRLLQQRSKIDSADYTVERMVEKYVAVYRSLLPSGE